MPLLARRIGARTRVVALAMSAVVAATAIAIAPSPWAVADTTKGTGTLSEAKTHMDKGQELYLSKKFAEAAKEYHAAYEIKPLSTFLFNEAVCHEKLAEYDQAIALFQKYVDTDTSAPDRLEVIARIEKLKARNQLALEAGVADGGEAGVAAEAGTPTEPTVATIDEMRSIVVVESLPDGAPVEIWQRTDAAAPKFVLDAENKGWTKVATGTTPLTQSLPLGIYHVVIPKFKDYHATDTDVTVAAATISQFKANLAQGAFFGVMKIRSYAGGAETRGAHVFVKKASDKDFVDHGVTPYEESLENGSYEVRVEQPGFKPMSKKIELEHGKIDEQRYDLERTDEGLLRIDVAGADEAEVIVDDRSVGKVTHGLALNVPVPNGPHRVKLKADDRKTYTVDVDVPRGEMVVVHSELRPSVPRGSAWTTGITAAVFLGAGIFLGVESNSTKNDLSNAKNTGRLDNEDPRIKKGQYFAIGADVCFGFAAILGVISIYNFVRDPLPDSIGHNEQPRDFDVLPAAPKPATAKLMPMGGPNVAGLSLVGEF